MNCEELAETAGAETVATMVQHIDRPSVFNISWKRKAGGTGS